MRATTRPSTLRRNQSGASLVLVLALIAFLALVVPAILGLVALGPRITKPVLEDRRELYAASSAIDAAVELGRTQPDVGVPGGPCPTQEMTIDSLDVTVECQQHASPGNGCLYLDRFVNFTAEVREPGDATVIARAATEVVYRFDLYALPKVEIRQWTPNASGPVTTLPLPDCNSTTSTTTTTTLVPTTSTSTTTTTTTPPTTTTVAPAGDVRTQWTAPTTSRDGPGNGAKWRGESTLVVTGANGTPVENAVVTVQAEYTRNGTDWFLDAPAQIPGTTNAAGTNTFHSSYFKRGNSGSDSATAIRLTVLSVTTPQGLVWNNVLSQPITQVVNAP